MKLKLLLFLALLVVLSGLLELERKPAAVHHHAPEKGLALDPDSLKTSVQITI